MDSSSGRTETTTSMPSSAASSIPSMGISQLLRKTTLVFSPARFTVARKRLECPMKVETKMFHGRS